jgi:hypothetical protein
MRKILVASLPDIPGAVISAREQPQDRDIVLPIIAGAPKGADCPLDLDHFPEKLVVHIVVNADSVS